MKLRKVDNHFLEVRRLLLMAKLFIRIRHLKQFVSRFFVCDIPKDLILDFEMYQGKHTFIENEVKNLEVLFYCYY